MAELAHFRVPAILIPYPFAAEDHQTRNAEVFADTGAAVLLPQSDLESRPLGPMITELLSDKTRLAEMKRGMHELGVSDAAERICDVIEQSASSKSRP